MQLFVLRPYHNDGSDSRFYKNELILVAIDDCSLSDLLRVLEVDKPERVELKSTGMVQEEAYVQKSLFKLAIQALDRVKDIILPQIM